MNFLTKKALSRRSALRGLGASISLPLLDAMIPAGTALASTAAQPVKRLGFVFMPMGADLSRWTPESENTLDNLSPILNSLAPVRQHVTAFTNLELQPAYPGSHATSNSAFLSAARAKLTESTDYFLGTTVDQVAAKNVGGDTALPSLELAMDLMQTVGQCDNGYACVYHNNLSWSSPTTPLPAEAHPGLVFEKLFGEGGTAEARRVSLQNRSSLLDFIKEDMIQLKKEVGTADRNLVDEYLQSVREVERRIQKAEQTFADIPEPDLERPLGVPASYAEHARLMFDLQMLALRGDVTRVITFQLARETSNRTYPEIGVPDPHHPLSHHGNDPAKIERMSKINAFHVSLFAEYLGRLAETREGNHSLLDQSLILYGSGIGNPNVHDHTNLPILLAGGQGVGIRGNRHIRYHEPVPLANLHLSLLDKAGVRRDKFGDSNGMISL
ncbi:MAG: DUF1552 domain-containing protein [Verrucomicrobiales bacterium]|nr:DUF1552 domain-containing protein [Verrucomicrobiales bacterium]